MLPRTSLLLLLLLLLLATAASAMVASPCGDARCRRSDSPLCVFGTERACACAASVRGTLCYECGFQGHLQNGTCVCARERDADPQAQCGKIVPVVALTSTTRSKTTIECACLHSWERGMYTSSSSRKRTGARNPPSCDACVSFGVGPQPSGVLDVEFGVEPQTCRRYGGLDPAKPTESTWNECSGHGTWSDAAKACACDVGWAARLTEYAGFNGERVATCDVCAPLWGPSPAQGCGVVVTPDPLSGTITECGGHGTFANAACRCFSNSTAGYWEARNVTVLATVWSAATREYTTTNFTQASCVACAGSKELSRGCR